MADRALDEADALHWANEAHRQQGTGDYDPALSIIRRCLDGEEQAYVLLYDRFAPMVFRLAYSLLQHREDAEEVLQDSFEYAFRRLDRYDHRKSAFTTWLYRITVSRCRNKRRRKWLPAISLNVPGHPEVPDLEQSGPDDLVDVSERRRLVWQALGQLSPKLRETAILRYFHGLRYREIGEILGISAKTVESRMRLAHRELRVRLEDSNLL